MVWTPTKIVVVGGLGSLALTVSKVLVSCSGDVLSGPLFTYDGNKIWSWKRQQLEKVK